jgi:uncharacterized protein YndB with AHSA1/START domain
MARRVYVAEVEIDAPPDAVWRVLVDFDAYPRWNPFTIEAKTTLEVGTAIDMRVKMSELGITVSQRETIREVDAPRRLVWGMRMLGGAVRAERVQTLTGGERTRYRSEDTIEGSLGALVFALFGRSVERGFTEMAAALRAEVERRRGSARGRPEPPSA